MTRLRRVAAHAVASLVFALATFCIFGGISQAAVASAEVMRASAQTGKCLGADESVDDALHTASKRDAAENG